MDQPTERTLLLLLSQRTQRIMLTRMSSKRLHKNTGQNKYGVKKKGKATCPEGHRKSPLAERFRSWEGKNFRTFLSVWTFLPPRRPLCVRCEERSLDLPHVARTPDGNGWPESKKATKIFTEMQGLIFRVPPVHPHISSLPFALKTHSPNSNQALLNAPVSR